MIEQAAVMSTEQTRELIQRYIEEVWNKGNLDLIPELVDPNYIDHSIPFPGLEGLKEWIQATSAAFNHQTIIEEQITENHSSALRITMRVKQIGEWRGIASSGKEAQTEGFRFYRLENGKIVEHWAHIDGDKLAAQLKS